MSCAASNGGGPSRPIPKWLHNVAMVGVWLVATPLGIVIYPWRRLMIMTHSDGLGRPTRYPYLAFSPAPTRVKRNGIDQVGEYVRRLFNSASPCPSVIISISIDGAFGVFRKDGIIGLSVFADVSRGPSEAAIRDFFNARRISPVRDYLSGEGRVPNPRRHLLYSLPDDCEKITSLVTSYLSEVYKVTRDQGLEFTYQERTAR
jgi:hypothetical protein